LPDHGRGETGLTDKKIRVCPWKAKQIRNVEWKVMAAADTWWEKSLNVMILHGDRSNRIVNGKDGPEGPQAQTELL